MKQWTDDELRALNASSLHTLWSNCRRHDSDYARDIVARIEGLELLVILPGGMPNDHPLSIKMSEIINSKEGKAAAIAATEAGQPAMMGIDPLLLAALGDSYTKYNQITMTAGSQVAEMMRSLGYKSSGRKGKLPAGCVAKTAEIFVKR
jgi:hypothetical protein